jgi:RNA polymerase sigma factor (sigma-70 family)
MAIVNDKQILERWIRHRDASAFQALVATHAGMVFATCCRLLGNGTDAEDVTQECFQTLALCARPPRGHLGAWLHRVATNLALKQIRSEARRRRREASFSGGQSTCSEANWNEVYALVDEAIACLPKKNREALIAHFLEAKTHTAIGEELGLPRQTVTNRIQRGLYLLRERLKDSGVTIPAAALSTLLASEAAEAVPASVLTGLGKLALSGSCITEVGVSHTIGQFIGVLAMKKVVTGVVFVIVFAALWVLDHEEPPGSEIVDGKQNVVSKLLPGKAVSIVQEPDGAETMTSVEAEGVGLAAELEVISEEGSWSGRPGEIESIDDYCSLSGMVVDFLGWPVAGASVTVVASGLGLPGDLIPSDAVELLMSREADRIYRAKSDANGRYRIQGIVFAGEALVSASAPSQGGAANTLILQPGDEVEEHDIQLPEIGAVVLGRIVTATGSPVQDATVTIGRNNGPELLARPFQLGTVGRTDHEGKFMLGFDRQVSAFMPVRLRVNSKTYGEAVFTRVPVNEYTELVLRDTGTLSGHVQWDDGTPASGVFIVLRPSFRTNSGTSRTVGAGPLYSSETLDDGSYEIEGIASSENEEDRFYYAITVMDRLGSILSQHRSDGVKFTPGESATWDKTLYDLVTVTGRVVGESSGRGLRDVEVSIVAAPDHTRSAVARTDETGAFNIQVPGGADKYLVVPHYFGVFDSQKTEEFGVSRTIVPGETVFLELSLPETLSASFEIVDLDGLAVEGASVRPWSKGETFSRSIDSPVSTGANGLYSWSGFPPHAENWVKVEKEGYTSAKSPVFTGEPGDALPLETVVLLPETGLEGRVIDVSGAPFANGTVVVLTNVDGMRKQTNVRSNDRGAFMSLGEIPPGFMELKLVMYRDSDFYPDSDSDTRAYTKNIGRVELTAGYVLDLGDVVLEQEEF